MPPLLQHTHTWKWSSSFSRNCLFFFTQTAKYERKRSPGGLRWFHMGDLKPQMSFLGQNSKNVYFLFAVTLREICNMRATAPEAVADRSAVLRKGSCVPISVESWVGTDVEPSPSLPLHIPTPPVSPSLRKQEDNLRKERCISPPLLGYNSAFLFYPLKYGLVPRSPWRLRTRKDHLMMVCVLCVPVSPRL